MRRRKQPNVFGLAFLDAMFYGFGAVVLLYMIVDHNTVAHRRAAEQALYAEAGTLEQAVAAHTREVVAGRSAVQDTETEQARLEAQLSRMAEELERKTRALDRLERGTHARSAHIRRLEADIRALEQDVARLKAAAQTQAQPGERLREFVGDGDRQYLTGLRMGGRRVLILLDSSASMLAETVVNVILRRNLPVERRRLSAKWQRAVATVDWISTQLPPTGRYQIYTFDTEARAVLEDTAGQWLKVAEVQTLDRAVESLYRSVPQGGTNLFRALRVAARMSPQPDMIYLITDGLPTQGRTGVRRGKVSGAERLKLFTEAVRALPASIPVNIILFFMEGDPMATSAYWKLAVATRGALVSPAQDWP